MTEKQKKEVERVCGKDFEQNDIPAIWRKEEELAEIERMIDNLCDEARQEELEKKEQDFLNAL